MAASTRTCKDCNHGWQGELLHVLRFCPACGQLAMTGRDYGLFLGSLFAISFVFFFVVFGLTRTPAVEAGPDVASLPATPETPETPAVPDDEPADPGPGIDPATGLPPLPPPPPGPMPGSEPDDEPAVEPDEEPDDPPMPLPEPTPEPEEPYRAELDAFEAARGGYDEALRAISEVTAERAPAARIATLRAAIPTLERAAAAAEELRAYALPDGLDRQLAAYAANIESVLGWAQPLLASTVEDPLHAVRAEAERLEERAPGEALGFWTALADDPDFQPYRTEVVDERDRLAAALEERWAAVSAEVEEALDRSDHQAAEAALQAFAALDLEAYREPVAALLAEVVELREELREEVADDLSSRVKRWLSARERLDCGPCGGDGLKKCSKCRGTGKLTVINLTGSGGRQQVDCNRCGAEGQRICEDCEQGISIDDAEELVEEYGGRAQLIAKDKKSSVEVQLSEDMRTALVTYEVKYVGSEDYEREASAWRWDPEREEWRVD